MEEEKNVSFEISEKMGLILASCFEMVGLSTPTHISADKMALVVDRIDRNRQALKKKLLVTANAQSEKLTPVKQKNSITSQAQPESEPVIEEKTPEQHLEEYKENTNQVDVTWGFKLKDKNKNKITLGPEKKVIEVPKYFPQADSIPIEKLDRKETFINIEPVLDAELRDIDDSVKTFKPVSIKKPKAYLEEEIKSVNYTSNIDYYPEGTAKTNTAIVASELGVMRTQMKMLLQQEGYKALTVCSIKDLVPILKKTQFDIVVVEVKSLSCLISLGKAKALMDEGSYLVAIIADLNDMELQFSVKDMCKEVGVNIYLEKIVNWQLRFHNELNKLKNKYNIYDDAFNF